MKLRPELLTHSTIPKALHGVNPRSIKGREWWDKTRKEAYRKNDNKCWACDLPASQSSKRKSLEAHENYDINYITGRVTLKEITALCSKCHNFIHSQRLWSLFVKGELTYNDITIVLEHGFNILYEAKLQYPINSEVIYLALDNVKDYKMSFEEAIIYAGRNVSKVRTFPNIEAKWEDWHLFFEEKKYYSPYKNEEAWRKHWS